VARQQAHEARKSRELSAVISLFNAHQSEDASHMRRLIRNGTIASRLDDPETRVQLRNYLNHLNFVATLSARHLVSDALLKDLFYEPAKACWERCAKPMSARSAPPRTRTSPATSRNGSAPPIREAPEAHPDRVMTGIGPGWQGCP
jgi:hypothetical protein